MYIKVTCLQSSLQISCIEFSKLFRKTNIQIWKRSYTVIYFLMKSEMSPNLGQKGLLLRFIEVLFVVKITGSVSFGGIVHHSSFSKTRLVFTEKWKTIIYLKTAFKFLELGEICFEKTFLNGSFSVFTSVREYIAIKCFIVIDLKKAWWIYNIAWKRNVEK